MYRICIVEDTPAEADNLRLHLARYEHEHNESFSVEQLNNAVEFIERKPKADLIFMDIDMKGINGMEAAKILRERDTETPLIFVTNLAQYAVHGYAVDALDFIVKPVEYTDFALRLDRAMRIMQRNAQETIALTTTDGTRMVALRDIVYVDILRHDLYYHLVSGEELRLRGSIKATAIKLGESFTRISSSCIINMARVKLIRQASVVMAGNIELYYSRAMRKTALEALNKFVGGG